MRTRNTRIALVSAAPSHEGSVAARRLLGLLARGWDAHLVLPDIDVRCWRPPAEFLDGSVARHVHALPKQRLAAARWLASGAEARRRNPRSALAKRAQHRLEGALTSLRPALVHFDAGDRALATLGIKRSLGCKLIASFWGDDINVAGIDSPDHYRSLWECADAFHFPDRALEERARRRGLPERALRAVIAPAVDLDLFAPAQDTARPREAARPLRILSVDRLEWTQGLEHAMHAVALVRDAGIDCEYLIVGVGRHLAALTFARHQLGLAGRVAIVEPRDRVYLREVLSAADLYLGAQVVDGIPEGVVQAFAAGRPVVMSNPGELGEDRLEPKDVAVVPRRDPEALARGLRVLAGDPELRQRMGRAARQLALERYQPEAELDRFEELYRRTLLSARGGRRLVAAPRDEPLEQVRNA